MLKVLAIVAVLSIAAAPAAIAKPPTGTPAANHGCDKSYTYKAAKRGLRKALRHEYPMTQAMGANAWKYVLCTRSRDDSRKLRTRRADWKKWRSSYAHAWPIRLNAQSATWIQWARNITACESGWNRYASNGSHFGWFQWAPSTWAAASAGFSPRPIFETSWHHQAVIAINWAKRAGVSQWVCRG